MINGFGFKSFKVSKSLKVSINFFLFSFLYLAPYIVSKVLYIDFPSAIAFIAASISLIVKHCTSSDEELASFQLMWKFTISFTIFFFSSLLFSSFSLSFVLLSIFLIYLLHSANPIAISFNSSGSNSGKHIF